MCSDRDREGGVTIVEVVVASVLLMVVMVPVFTGLSAVQRREMEAEGLARAVNDGRTALDRMTNDVRSADGLTQTSDAAGATLEVWSDADDDATEDASEIVTYQILAATDVLTRAEGAVTTTLVEGVVDGTFAVAGMNDGELLEVELSIDLDTQDSPADSVLRTKVLARNA